MTPNDLPFPHYWHGNGLKGYRECFGTYDRYPESFVPPINDLLTVDHFAWLNEIPLKDVSKCDIDFESDFQIKFEAIKRQAAEQNLILPSEFVQFMGDLDLRGRSPGITANWNLPDFIDSCPDAPGALIMCRSDGQGVLYWYLYIDINNHQHCVLASSDQFGLGNGDGPTFWDEPNRFFFSAASFEEFVYRQWIENSIAVSLFHGTALTPRQQTYLEFYRIHQRRCEIHDCELVKGFELLAMPKAEWFPSETRKEILEFHRTHPDAGTFKPCTWMRDAPPECQIQFRQKANCPICQEALVQLFIERNLHIVLGRLREELSRYGKNERAVSIMRALRELGF